jgi:spore germination protein GerM
LPAPFAEPEIPAENIPSPQLASPTPPATETSAATERPADTRERGIFFMQAGRSDTELLPVRTSRSIRVSDSPLIDSLNALLAGPTAEEKTRGVLHFIPPETRIISVIVRGNTAYINFNDEFQYNTHGREGSAAQIRQIVWTATEFPNVHDVQFLVENRRLDFLAEGVMIGSPIGR